MTDKLRKAAQAVINRWESPDWSDGTHTRDYIFALRDALAEPIPIDALIAEIDDLRMPIDGDKLNAILDKYRIK